MQEAVDTILKFVFVQCPKKILSSAIFWVTWQSQKQRITKTDSVREQKSVIINNSVIVTQITKCTIIRNPVRKDVFPGCNDNGPTLFKNDIIDENDDAVVARKIRETDIVFFPPRKIESRNYEGENKFSRQNNLVVNIDGRKFTFYVFLE